MGVFSGIMAVRNAAKINPVDILSLNNRRRKKVTQKILRSTIGK
jgi:hypothetical protein